MTSIIFDPDAKTEFLDSVLYYRNRSSGLGKQFRSEVFQGLLKITESPFRYRSFHPPFRRFLLDRFPYAIIYSIEPDHIHILAVAHTKRQPDYWMDRA